MGSFAVWKVPVRIVVFCLSVVAVHAVPAGAQVFVGASVTQEEGARASLSPGLIGQVILPIGSFVSIGGGGEFRYFTTGSDVYTVDSGQFFVGEVHGLLQLGAGGGQTRPFVQMRGGVASGNYSTGNELFLSFGGGIDFLSGTGSGWRLVAELKVPQKQDMRVTKFKQWAVHIGKAF